MAAKLNALPGVSQAEVNFTASKLKITHVLNAETIISAVKNAGYKATLLSEDKKIQYVKRSLFKENIPLFIAVMLWLFSYATPVYSDYFNYVVIVLTGWEIAFKGIRNLFRKEMDMNFLMTVAILGAVFIGQVSEGATVALLFGIGEFLEAFSTERTKKAIRNTLDLTPHMATIVNNGFEIEIPVEEVKLGSVILVRPGERIPLDGKVSKGSSDVNEAPITGESVPVAKSIGDKVFAGTINENGVLEIITTSIASNTALAKVRKLVEEAQGKKAQYELVIERFAKIYTPLVTLLAVLVVFIPTVIFHQPFKGWFYKGLVLLVIACPCALVISTPVAVVATIGKAAKKGILIRGGTYLELLSKLRFVAFDKTGTLTTGRLRVTEIVADDADEILAYAVSIEQMLNHPLAEAIKTYAIYKGIKPLKIENFKNEPGFGAKAVVKEKSVLLGSKKYFQREGINADFPPNNNPIIAVAVDGICKGFILFEDDDRRESKGIIKELTSQGIGTVMLTGDNYASAENVAARLGIKNFYAELLPQEKLQLLKKIKDQGITAMVGDGINDAPALAQADIGIAMGRIGSDLAAETADIVFMHDNLYDLPSLLKMAKRMTKTIKINIALSIGVKVLFVLLTMLGLSNLWMAVFADTGTTLLVTSYSLRLLK